MNAAEIARVLNGRLEGRRWRCSCPACGRGNLTICDMRGGRHLVKCWNGCDYKEIFIALFAQGLLHGDDDDRRRDERRRRNHEAEERHQREEIEKLARRIEQAGDLYRRSVPPWVIEIYLRSRGITLPVLRFLQHCPHRPDPGYNRDYYPAMLGPVVDVDGRQIGDSCHKIGADGKPTFVAICQWRSRALSNKPTRRNTLTGFVTLRFASGLKPNDCPVHVHPNARAWCAAQWEHAAKILAERQRRRARP